VGHEPAPEGPPFRSRGGGSSLHFPADPRVPRSPAYKRRGGKKPGLIGAGEASGSPALLRPGGARLFPANQAGAPGSIPLRPVPGGRDGEAVRGGHFAARPVAKPGPDRLSHGGFPGYSGVGSREGERGGAPLPRRDRGNGLPPPVRDGLACAGRELHGARRSRDPFRGEPSPPVAEGSPGQRLVSAGPSPSPAVLRVPVLGPSGHRRHASLRGPPG